MNEFENPAPDVIRNLLGSVKTIAVVGLSPKSDRPSFQVAAALQRFGFRIIPVRPATSEVLGEKAYAELRDIPCPVDLVNVFRAPEHVPPVIDACIELKIPAVWLQEGVTHSEAAARAVSASLTVVMDRCIYKDYVALF